MVDAPIQNVSKLSQKLFNNSNVNITVTKSQIKLFDYILFPLWLNETLDTR